MQLLQIDYILFIMMFVYLITLPIIHVFAVNILVKTCAYMLIRQ